ncbi:hypothetical protein EGY05_12950 [Chryseobacterium arthrosphaerae]|uniref:hypothetical protein n=1 Tax=Chryseobacterium arthrosphaerae TaxID=651561 RepID=UPI000F4FDC73|nr:hypothetical protein [Chryseobacterium arthrosphaerae]AYZ12773.1 hypothetical protein EGY05_12950 [Chryseobacterium arthrosphaerae]
MKNIILTAILSIIPAIIHSQVIIGKGKATVTNPSVSLEFGDVPSPSSGNINRGIVLPYVTSANADLNSVNGTLIFDPIEKKVKIKQANSWFDLSYGASTVNSIDTSIQTNKTENTNAKVSIGTPSSTPGILVLEDVNKAMLLPRITDPHITIINPAPGMIVYDKIRKLLLVFNGTEWSFWKS